MKELKNRFALKTFREKQDLTQKEMAEKIGVSYSYYVGLELGRYDPSYKTMSKFVEAFDCKSMVWELFEKGA